MPYANKEWRRNSTYKTKQEQSEEMDPAEHIAFGDKGVVSLSYAAIGQLRDFLLDGTSLEVVERKRFYQSKDFVPADPALDGPKKKATNKKEEKKEEKKDNSKKSKKGTSSQVLDNYNLVSTEDRLLASFDMDLSQVMEGGGGMEVQRKFSFKMKVDTKIHLDVPGTATTGKAVGCSGRGLGREGHSMRCIGCFKETPHGLNSEAEVFEEVLEVNNKNFKKNFYK